MVVSENRATPIHHPFLDGIFQGNKPSSYWVPPWLWKAPYWEFHHPNCQSRIFFRWLKHQADPENTSIWGFPARKMGLPQARWLVFVGDNPNLEMDDDWGYPYDETETPRKICFYDLLIWWLLKNWPGEKKSNHLKRAMKNHPISSWNHRPGWCDGCGAKIKSGEAVWSSKPTAFFRKDRLWLFGWSYVIFRYVWIDVC